MMPDSAEVLHELILLDKTNASAWLEAALKALPTHNSGGAITATQEQLTAFHSTATG